MPTTEAASRLDPLVLTAMIALGIYALLLGAGGYIGYARAGSKPSLIAGSIGAVVAFASLILSYFGGFGFWLGLVLAAMMTVSFAARFRKTGKFLPSGMLGIVSLAMIALIGLALSRLG